MFALDVLNPVARTEGVIKISKAAPRPGSLDGLALGLIWNSKRGGEIALMKAGELISRKYKDVKVIRYDGSMPCDVELLERAKRECNVFVGSTGD